MKNYLILLSLLISIAFIACSQDQKNEEPKEAISNSKLEKTGKLTVTDTWVRVGAKGRNTAMFMNIKNGTEQADTLLSAESDAAVLVEVHETYKSENDMMGMRQVEHVIVPSLQQVSLKPRGLHVMLITLNEDIQIGDSVNASLNFSRVGKVNITGIAKEMGMPKNK